MTKQVCYQRLQRELMGKHVYVFNSTIDKKRSSSLDISPAQLVEFATDKLGSLGVDYYILSCLSDSGTLHTHGFVWSDTKINYKLIDKIKGDHRRMFGNLQFKNFSYKDGNNHEKWYNYIHGPRNDIKFCKTTVKPDVCPGCKRCNGISKIKKNNLRIFSKNVVINIYNAT